MMEVSGQLITTLLKNSCKIRLKTSGSSMIPHIFPNEIATIIPLSESLTASGIYLYISDNQLILHRLHKVSSLSSGVYTFKGDANNFLDPPVMERQIIGQLGTIRSTPTSIKNRIEYLCKKLFNEIYRI